MARVLRATGNWFVDGLREQAIKTTDKATSAWLRHAALAIERRDEDRHDPALTEDCVVRAGEVLSAGQGEVAKGCVHLAMFGLAAVCFAYNSVALSVRPSRQLGFNALVYGGLLALEARQTFSHFASTHPNER